MVDQPIKHFWIDYYVDEWWESWPGDPYNKGKKGKYHFVLPANSREEAEEWLNKYLPEAKRIEICNAVFKS